MFVSGHVNFLLIQCLFCVLANKDNTNIRHASKSNYAWAGKWTNWQPWSACSTHCGKGWKTRSRDCENAYGFHCTVSCVGDDKDVSQCEDHTKCKVDGHWTTWKSWGQCTKSCGNGVRQRIRSCTNPRPQNVGLICPDTSRQFSSCNKQSCPVNGHWSRWSRWSSCSRTCGNGTKQRTRTCDNPKPKYGGSNCLGYRKMTAACSRLPHCPIHGHWSEWSRWSPCSRTCGSGTIQRTRTCNNPAPKYGGHRCTGQRKMKKGCSRLLPCPIHGHWSKWSRWSSCSKTCGSGTILRTRTCNNPSPKYGGHNCHGYRKERSACSKLPPCPVHGSWSNWSKWSSCLKTCGDGMRQRTRACNNPTPTYGGNQCVGSTGESASCDLQLQCPVDGNWTPWQKESLCTVMCGGGIMREKRTCDNPAPKYGGKQCRGQSFRTISCSTATCPTTVSLTNLTTAFAQVSKVKSTTRVPKFAWQTINIPPG